MTALSGRTIRWSIAPCDLTSRPAPIRKDP